MLTAVSGLRRPADKLARAKAYPHIIETAVRGALHDAVAWRIGGGRAPSREAFATAAVSAARQMLDALGAEGAERPRTASAVAHAARCFYQSALGRRLMSVPASQFVPIRRAAGGPDVVIRDRYRRLHAVALRLECAALDAGLTASAIAKAAPLPPADRLNPLTFHIFSLQDGRRFCFERDGSVERAAGARVA